MSVVVKNVSERARWIHDRSLLPDQEITLTDGQFRQYLERYGGELPEDVDADRSDAENVVAPKRRGPGRPHNNPQ